MNIATRTVETRPLTSTLIRACSISVLLFGSIQSGPASADWEYYPVLRLAVDSDDNATLTSRTDEIIDTTGFMGEARFGIEYSSAKNTFVIEPVYRSRKYDDDSFLDSDDQFLNLRMRHDGTFNTFNLRGNYSREDARTAELADTDLDPELDPEEIEDDDTGRIDLRQRREKIRIVPRWTRRLSDTSRIDTDLNFVTVDFEDEDQQQIGLTDYTDVRARIAYGRSFSARNTALVRATFRDYQTDFLDGDFSGYGLSAGFDQKLTQNSTFRALVGVELTEQIDESSEKPHFVADVSFVRRQETTQLLLQYKRSIAASGRGALARRDEVNLRFTRDLTDKFATGIGARAYQTERLATVENETTYVQLNAQLIWRLSNDFSLQANYRYTVIDRDVIGESANSNRITIWFSYQPNSQSRISFIR